MRDLITYLSVVIAALLIVVVLVQSGKTDGISAAFSGNGDLNLYAVTKQRGIEKGLAIFTAVLGIVLYGVVLILNMM